MAAADLALRARWSVGQIPGHARSERELPPAVRQTLLVDRINGRRLLHLVGSCGWPRSRREGEQAVHDAWLIAQHAAPQRQQVLLRFLAHAVARGDAPAGQ